MKLFPAAVVAVLVCTLLVVAPGIASADSAVEAETMTWTPTAGGVVGAQTGASAGSALTLLGNATASKTLTLAASSKVVVRAKAQLCLGAPSMKVKVDGTVIATMTVMSTAWTDYVASSAISAGSHTISVEYTNEFKFSTSCDRNLLLDKVTVVSTAVATTTPPTTTPPPTTTTPPATTTPPTTTTPPPTTTITTTTPPPTTTSTTPPPTSPCPVGQYRARYYNNTNATGTPVVDRCEFSVGGRFSSSPTAGVNADNFSVDYTGQLNFPQTANYAFNASTGDAGVRVWLDGQSVLDKWTSSYWGDDQVLKSVPAGLHTVQVRYFDTSGVALEEFSVTRASHGVASTNGNFFAVDSFWNTPVPAGAVVDSRSAGWATALMNHPSISQISVNDDAWTVPIYRAPPGTPKVTIRVTNKNKNIQVPYLSSYRPSPDSDSHLAIIDQATGCEYEFQTFNASKKTAIAQATYRVDTGSGGHVSGPAHAGGELSYLGGLITPQDVSAGVIDHALRFAVPIGAPSYLYPGTRSDGTTANGIPQGIRAQLDPNLDLNQFNLTPFQRMVAVALQTYGAFNADTASAFALYAQSMTDGSTYSQPIGDLPEALIGHLRFLQPTVASTDLQLDGPADIGCAQPK